ncbi:hypothetical protein ACW9H2_24965, partial [Pseudomonas gingeri]
MAKYQSCRRWLAGDQALKSCGAHPDVIASKPAPTKGGITTQYRYHRDPCRSWLAGDQALKSCGAHPDVIASKPAPTKGGITTQYRY